jgi:hypothetical protein
VRWDEVDMVKGARCLGVTRLPGQWQRWGSDEVVTVVAGLEEHREGMKSSGTWDASKEAPKRLGVA